MSLTLDQTTSETNSQNQTKIEKHLSIPENRINYSFYFLHNFDTDFVDYKKCYDAISKWSDKLDTSESHY